MIFSWTRRVAMSLVLVSALLLGTMFVPVRAAEPPDILNLTLREMRSLMDAGQLTSVQIVEFYLERITRYEDTGPTLNTIRALNMDIWNQADALDRELQAGRIRGPLHGIPILIKDNIDAVGFPTTAGSLALEHHWPTEDSPLVAGLRNAGAIIMGKSNMTEWANYISNAMVNGFSSLGGYVLNPYGPGVFDVSGSSSGSAAAVAAGLAPAAIGTETSGSIVSPANQNSVVGLKPTVGLISRRGIIPISPSQDTAGPMTRNVADLAVLMNAMVGVDPRDAATFGTAHHHRDYTAFLNPNALQGARIGIAVQEVERLAQNMELNGERIAMFERALEELTSLGAVLVDVEMPGFWMRFEYTSHVLRYEFKPALNAYLQNTAPHVPVSSLACVIAFNAQDPAVRMRYNQVLMENSQRTSGSLTEAEFIISRIRDRRYNRDLGIDYALREFNVTAVLYPGNGGWIVARAGYPTLNQPIGYLANGLPYGMTWAGGAFTEGTLIGYAYAYERAFPARVWPVFE